MRRTRQMVNKYLNLFADSLEPITHLILAVENFSDEIDHELALN